MSPADELQALRAELLATRGELLATRRRAELASASNGALARILQGLAHRLTPDELADVAAEVAKAARVGT